MNSKLSLLLLIAIYLTLTANFIAKGQSAKNDKPAPLSWDRNRVSMVAVLANPNKFDGKQISMDGILHFVMEDDTLYLNREMANALLKVNGVSLSYSKSKLQLRPSVDSQMYGKKVGLDYFNNKLCNVYGVFDAKKMALKNITYVFEDNIVVKKD